MSWASAYGPYNPKTGWVALPNLLSAQDIAETLSICCELLALPVAERHVGDKPVAGTHHLVSLHARSATIDQFVHRPALVDVVTQVLGADHHLDQCGYRSPQPGHGRQSLHTDDVSRTTVGADTVATAIVALTDFTQTNGSTRLVPASHQRLDLQRQAGNLKHHSEEILLTGPAGTAFVFSGHVLHSGTQNTSVEGRPALQIIWRTGKGAPTG